MSIDSSLRIKGALTRHRNVLTRAERIAKLKEEERWSEGESVFGLPKVVHRKSHAGRKAKEAPAEAATPAAGAAPTAEAAPPPAPKSKGKTA